MTGIELREVRNELGLRQDEMAVAMGFPSSRIAHAEQRGEGQIPEKLEAEVLKFHHSYTEQREQRRGDV